MPAELIGHFEAGSPEWHAARADGLGGSEIAAVLGLSKWASRYSLWHEKRGLAPKREQNNPMTVGKYVEPSILRWWCDQHPEYDIQTAAGTYRSSERPWQIANPDHIAESLAADAAIVECKFAIYDTDWVDGPPPYYLAQCQWYLDVFDLDLCYVAVLFGGSGRFDEFEVRRDDADIALMRREARAFLDSLDANERPDIDEHGATYEVLRHNAPGVGTGELEVSLEVAEQFWHARMLKQQADEAVQFATNRVMGLLNDTDRKKAVHDGRPVAHKECRNGGNPYLKASRGAA